jgi:hypothetical protein
MDTQHDLRGDRPQSARAATPRAENALTGRAQLIRKYQHLIGNHEVARLYGRPRPVLPPSGGGLLQRDTQTWMFPGADNQLKITFTDNYFKNLALTGDNDADIFRQGALMGHFEDAAQSLQITDKTAAVTYRFVERVQFGDFNFMVRWDQRQGRLFVTEFRYTGANRHPLLKPSSALRWKIEQVGAPLGREHDAAVERLWQLCHEYGLSLQNITVSDSSGTVLTLIPNDANFVLQYYKYQLNFERVRDDLQKLRSEDNSGRARVLAIDEPNRIIAVERVAALNMIVHQPNQSKEEAARQTDELIRQNANQVFVDIRDAIVKFAADGLSQGDTRLDNVGVRNGKFVLFDYNGVGKVSVQTLRRDFRTLIESFDAKGAKLDQRYRSNPLDGATVPLTIQDTARAFVQNWTQM